MRTVINSRISGLERAASTSDHIKNTQLLRRKMRLEEIIRSFLKTNRKMVLTGVIVRNKDAEVVIDASVEMQKHITEFWKSKYNNFVSCPDSIRSFLSTHGRLYDFSGTSYPSSTALLAICNKQKDASPGKDGLPYSAYCCESACTVLWALSSWIREGRSVDSSYGDTLTVFAPKSDSDSPQICKQVERHTDELRPIGLRNSNLKLLNAGASQAMSSTIEKCVSKLQRGFVRNRQFLDNCLVLDTLARIWASSDHKHAFAPAIFLLDFANAFGSISHDWAFACLSTAGVPSGLQYLIKASLVHATFFRTVVWYALSAK